MDSCESFLGIIPFVYIVIFYEFVTFSNEFSAQRIDKFSQNYDY